MVTWYCAVVPCDQALGMLVSLSTCASATCVISVVNRLPSRHWISGSAKFLPPPKIRQKNCSRCKRRQIYKIRLAAAKTSANLELSLKWYTSLADFKRGIWVCKMLALGMFPTLTKLDQLQSCLYLLFSVSWMCVYSWAGLVANGRQSNLSANKLHSICFVCDNYRLLFWVNRTFVALPEFQTVVVKK